MVSYMQMFKFLNFISRFSILWLECSIPHRIVQYINSTSHILFLHFMLYNLGFMPNIQLMVSMIPYHLNNNVWWVGIIWGQDYANFNYYYLSIFIKLQLASSLSQQLILEEAFIQIDSSFQLYDLFKWFLFWLLCFVLDMSTSLIFSFYLVIINFM